MTNPLLTPVIVRNLISGQYQIDDLVFGRGTTVPVESFEIKPDDVNNMDYQIARADEKRFGWDQFSPTTIDITFDVLENRLLPPFEGSIPNFWEDMPTVSDFKRAWRGDDVRYVWGQMKALYCCGSDGVTRAIYGRPGQFTYGKKTDYTEALQCIAEWRRGDTLAYSVDETVYGLSQGAPAVVIPGTAGDAPSWFRILLLGPITNPVFTITGLLFNGVTQSTPFQIGIGSTAVPYSVAGGELVEINAYPWTRRAVSSTGLNLSAALSGVTPYLDRLRFAHDSTVGVTMTGSGMSGATEGAVLFYDAYQVVG
jgi:hypothetical protein